MISMLGLVFLLVTFTATYYRFTDNLFDLAAATDSKRSQSFLVGIALVLSAIVAGLYIHYHLHYYFYLSR
jgi:hypothetical protein